MKLKDAYASELSYDQPKQHVKKRDITFITKVHLVKAMVFPVVMYGCESWTVKKAEWWRIDAFELWCCRRLLKVPWTARRFNLSILKEISSEYSLEGNDAEAGTPILWPPDAKSWLIWKYWCWERLKVGREREQRMRWLDGITDSMTWVWVSSGCWWWTREAWHAAVHGVTKSQTRLTDWAELNILIEKTINSLLYNNKYRHSDKILIWNDNNTSLEVIWQNEFFTYNIFIPLKLIALFLKKSLKWGKYLYPKMCQYHL